MNRHPAIQETKQIYPKQKHQSN